MVAASLLLGTGSAAWGAEGSAAPAAVKAPSKAEKALMDVDAAWAAAAGKKDVDATASFYADDGSVYPQNSPVATGKENVKKVWASMFGIPGFSISWAPTGAGVSKGGDLGWTAGTYQLSMNGPDGKPVSDKGKYVVVWKKVGGKWKAAHDIFNTDMPAPPPPKQGA
jgi:ketosteroid isomerase-like protein